MCAKSHFLVHETNKRSFFNAKAFIFVKFYVTALITALALSSKISMVQYILYLNDDIGMKVYCMSVWSKLCNYRYMIQ